MFIEEGDIKIEIDYEKWHSAAIPTDFRPFPRILFFALFGLRPTYAFSKAYRFCFESARAYTSVV